MAIFVANSLLSGINPLLTGDQCLSLTLSPGGHHRAQEGGSSGEAEGVEGGAGAI